MHDYTLIPDLEAGSVTVRHRQFALRDVSGAAVEACRRAAMRPETLPGPLAVVWEADPLLGIDSLVVYRERDTRMLCRAMFLREERLPAPVRLSMLAQIHYTWASCCEEAARRALLDPLGTSWLDEIRLRPAVVTAVAPVADDLQIMAGDLVKCWALAWEAAHS